MNPSPTLADFNPLLKALRDAIVDGRKQVLRSVDTVQVQTYWQVGRHIVEFEQGGEARAKYGKSLLAAIAQELTKYFGRGFDERNLRHMRAFYLSFPIRDALRSELSWTHYRLLLRMDSPTARQWYVQEATEQNWSTRVLERQIGSLHYERLLSSKDEAGVLLQGEVQAHITDPSPRDFVRDPVMLEFLGLPETGRLLEADDRRVPLALCCVNNPEDITLLP